MKRAKIQDKDPRYTLLKHIVNLRIHTAFRRIRILGSENIPHDGAVIYAPNHSSGLMDALLVLCASPGDKVFVARADMFGIKGLAKVLRFLRIMPIYRIKDGMQSLAGNIRTIDDAVDTLRDGVPFCIFPEGTHRPMHSLLPLTKGVFHIALKACGEMGDGKRLRVVPVGIEYGDYFRYRTSATVRFGCPIDITAYLASHSGTTQPHLMELLRGELTERMRGLITYIPADGGFESTWETVKTVTAEAYATGADTLPERQAVVATLQRLRSEAPDKAATLLAEAGELARLRHKYRISGASFTGVPLGIRVTEEAMKALFGLPFCLVAGVAMLPAWAADRVLKRYAVEDKAMYNTVTFGIDFLLVPLLLIAWGIFLFCNTPWQLACVLTLMLLPSFAYLHDYARLVRQLVSDFRLACHSEMRAKHEALKRHYKEFCGGGNEEEAEE